jgi:hypothetical protein
MPSFLPADDVAAQIAGAGLGWALATNLFVSDVAPSYQTDTSATGTPSASVFVLLAGGYDIPTRYQLDTYANAPSATQAREPRVMIYVRSPRQQYNTGMVSARAVKDALHDQPLQIGSSGSYYDACRIVDAEPTLLSETDNGEFLFSLNCHLYLDA